MADEVLPPTEEAAAEQEFLDQVAQDVFPVLLTMETTADYPELAAMAYRAAKALLAERKNYGPLA